MLHVWLEPPDSKPCPDQLLLVTSAWLFQAMPSQLTENEQAYIDDLFRARRSATPMEALLSINKKRARACIEETTKATLYRYINGETHRRGRREARGRKPLCSKADARKLDTARKALIKKRKGRVTHDAVQAAAGLGKKFCKRVAQNALRQIGVRYRRPREKIYLSEDDAKNRLATCKPWTKRPASYWTSKAYFDCKQWPLPLTKKQRTHFQQTTVSGHLRKASEGVSKGFTKPRQKHAWIGMPSVGIAALVNKNRIIMWHVLKTRWNGATAAKLYKGPLLGALKRAYGKKQSYTIIEDGDRKGNQSRAGIAAKREAKIRAITLPPRTPSLMPLDYKLWQVIGARMQQHSVRGKETKEAYLARLEKTARGLPRSLVGKCVSRMKGNVQAIVDAKGWHPKND